MLAFCPIAKLNLIESHMGLTEFNIENNSQGCITHSAQHKAFKKHRQCNAAKIFECPKGIENHDTYQSQLTCLDLGMGKEEDVGLSNDFLSICWNF